MFQLNWLISYESKNSLVKSTEKRKRRALILLQASYSTHLREVQVIMMGGGVNILCLLGIFGMFYKRNLFS